MRTSSALVPLAMLHAVPYAEYILAPTDRRISPSKILAVEGDVQCGEAPCINGWSSTTFTGINSSVTLDFGKNIAGTVHFTIDSVSGAEEWLGFTFTESSMWISPYLCDSASNATYDDPLWFPIPSTGYYAAEKKHQRGGFRYMSIWHNSTGSLTIRNVWVNFTASPEMADPSQYVGYFNSDSEKLNRVWYAGAYTNQLCSMDPAYGSTHNVPGKGWYLNATISNGTSVLVDGAKRDRLLFSGDIAISAPSTFVSTNSLDGTKNGISSLFLLQQSDGRLPWVGVPYARPDWFPFSFTYHLYLLLDLYYYHLFSGDDAYLLSLWSQYKLALSWAVQQIDESGMANVTSPNDWLRSGMGGHNVEANAMLYHTLDISITLAKFVGDTNLIDQWLSAMQTIKKAVNTHLWDPTRNLFYDNDTNQTANAVRPQDGNSWAIVSGIVNADRAAAISTSLMRRWIRPYGAPAPEAGATISPFATGFEVQAHYLAGHAERAVELIEFMWADFMLDDPRMTNSSLIEGYSTNGSLHYPPYENDARVSHAHGWSSGPTAALTFYGAGIRLTGIIGRTWLIKPMLGGLRRAEAGFQTPLGGFSANWTSVSENGVIGHFKTPVESSGTLILPANEVTPTLRGAKGRIHPSNTTSSFYTFESLPGGMYIVGKA